MDIITVVLGADTKKDRTKDSIKIIEYAFANYRMVDLEYMLHEQFDKLVQDTEFEIIKGQSNNLMMDLENIDIGLYPVNINQVKDVESKVQLKRELIAPVKKGDYLRENYHKYSEMKLLKK